MTPEAIGARLTGCYRAIHATAMRDAPICNDALAVEGIGFRDVSGLALGAVITPWFLNLFVAPLDSAQNLPKGALKLRFPAGEIEFAVSALEEFGPLASCSLFSPMSEFADQDAAREAARAALDFLFNAPEAAPAPPREGLDRRAFFGRRRGRAQSDEARP